MATFGDMTGAVLTAVRLRPDTDRASVRRVLNDAYLDVAQRLELTQTSKAVEFFAAQGDYSIRDDLGITDLLSISSIIGPANGAFSNLAMEPTYASRLLGYRTTETVSGSAPYMYALYGIDTLMVYPIPTGTVAATIYYSAQPDDLSADSDIPDLLPANFHRVIEDRAIEFAAGRWGRNSQLAADAHQRFLAGLSEAQIWLSERDGVGTKEVLTLSRRRWRPHDRSTDLGAWR